MMRGFFAEQIDARRRRLDPLMLAIVVVLVITGLGMLWSASWYRAEQLYGEPLRFVMRHALWLTVGAAVGLVAAFIPLTLVRRLLPLLLLGSVVLALLTFVPGVSARYMGARRWIILFNVSFQPSELLKLVMIIYLAHILSRHKGDFSQPMSAILPPLSIVGVMAVIVLLQNDFSTTVFLMTLALAMFFVAGVPMSYFLRVMAVLGPVGLIALFTREHRVMRIIAFLNPEYDPTGSGYQILAARRALEQGGFWGVGIGRGTRKLGGLPEAQSDFLFAVLGEELGLVGVVLVLGLFLLFAGRGLHLARRQDDWFRALLVFGMTVSILLQALLNIAVVAGAVPATGIPLPFFSAGGSSLLITFAMCGLLLNAAGSPGSETRRSGLNTVGSRLWEGPRG